MRGKATTGSLRKKATKIDANGKLVAPLDPGKIVCVGLNYLDHVTERDPNRTIPEEPVLFMKPTSSVIGPGDVIQIANPQNQTDYEAEVALVVGKTARDVSQANWRDYIAGFTCANDVSDRTLQKKDGQWVRAKGFHTYCPVGPWIETELDLDQAVVQSRLNGELRQDQAVSTHALSDSTAGGIHQPHHDARSGRSHPDRNAIQCRSDESRRPDRGQRVGDRNAGESGLLAGSGSSAQTRCWSLRPSPRESD